MAPTLEGGENKDRDALSVQELATLIPSWVPSRASQAYSLRGFWYGSIRPAGRTR